MKLYHGASGALRAGLAQKGIQPIGDEIRTVMLTSSYPMYFSQVAADAASSWIVVEISPKLLDTFFLVPDLDLPKDRIKSFLGTDAWQTSLEALGTCLHVGAIAPDAFTRLVDIPIRQNKHFYSVFDATNTLMNYKLLGDRYKWKTRHLFGDPIPPEVLDDPIIGPVVEFPHEGLTISEFEHGKVVRKYKLPPCPGERYGHGYQKKLLAADTKIEAALAAVGKRG